MHRKWVVLISRTIKILISNWPRTRKCSQLLQAGKAVDFDFSHHSHALRPIFMLWLVKIWQHLETCLLIAETDWILCYLVMFLIVFLHWMFKMNYSCYQDSSVIHGWFVFWVFGWESQSHRKSDFAWYRFQNWPCLMRIRGLKSLKKFWPFLMVFGSCISIYCYWCLFFFLVSWSHA